MTTGEKIELTAWDRKPGRGACRQLRMKRYVPAVVYGPNREPISISLEERQAVKYSRHGYENTIFTLKSEDKTVNGVQVLRKALDIHPLTRKPIHMDFYALDMKALVYVNVELRFQGTPLGVKEGGVFNAVRRELEIECLPTEIPEGFDVDISGLNLDDSLHVSDLKIPAGIKVITAPDLTICTVAEVREEAEVSPEDAAAVSAAALAGDEGTAKAEGGGEKKD